MNAEAETLSADLRQGALQNPVGFGSLIGEDSGSNSYALVIDGHNHFQQRSTVWGIRQYGFSESRLELGNHVGVNLDAISGITLIGTKEVSSPDTGQSTSSDQVAPQIGIEPFSARVTWSTLSNHLNYYEWFPMVSAGAQAVLGKYRVLAVGRAGAAAGNLYKGHFGPEFDPAYGAGLHLNSARVDFATSLTRVLRESGYINLATVDLVFQVKHSVLDVGLRGELTKVAQSPPGTITPDERQILLLFRGDLFAL